MTLVVFGHVLLTLPHDEGSASMILWIIYLFHMPAFALISGIVASPTPKAKTTLRTLVTLLLFQPLYLLVVKRHLPTSAGEWLQPVWVLWYLLSLVWWRLLSVPTRRAGRAAIPMATAIALVAGCVNGIGYPLSLSRTLVFLPFFVIGQAIRPGHSESGWQPPNAQVRWSLVLLGMALATLATTYMPADIRWLYGSFSYEALDHGWLKGSLSRILHLLGAACATLAFLVALPELPHWTGEVGRRSLTIYIGHGLFIGAAPQHIGRGLTASGFPLLGACVLTALLVWMFSRTCLHSRLEQWLNTATSATIGLLRRPHNARPA